jgi:hypothetical protein
MLIGSLAVGPIRWWPARTARVASSGPRRSRRPR